MNMKKILLALGIGAGVGAAYYFAKKKLDEMQEENEMYYDMYAAHPYTPGPAGPAKRSAAAAAETPASAELTAEEEDTEPPFCRRQGSEGGACGRSSGDSCSRACDRP